MLYCYNLHNYIHDENKSTNCKSYRGKVTLWLRDIKTATRKQEYNRYGKKIYPGNRLPITKHNKLLQLKVVFYVHNLNKNVTMKSVSLDCILKLVWMFLVTFLLAQCFWMFLVTFLLAQCITRQFVQMLKSDSQDITE